MKHYLFTDQVTGEDFIVGAYDVHEAFDEALELFDDPLFICELTDDEAENSGLDEY